MKSREVLDLLGISRATLTNYVERGLIKVKERPFGRYDYDRESVEALIDPDYKYLRPEGYNNNNKVPIDKNEENYSEAANRNHQDDAIRIQKICLDNLYDVSLSDCIFLWERYSFINSVQWTDLPDSDIEVWRAIEDKIKEE